MLGPNFKRRPCPATSIFAVSAPPASEDRGSALLHTTEPGARVDWPACFGVPNWDRRGDRDSAFGCRACMHAALTRLWDSEFGSGIHSPNFSASWHSVWFVLRLLALALLLPACCSIQPQSSPTLASLPSILPTCSVLLLHFSRFQIFIQQQFTAHVHACMRFAISGISSPRNLSSHPVHNTHWSRRKRGGGEGKRSV